MPSAKEIRVVIVGKVVVRSDNGNTDSQNKLPSPDNQEGTSDSDGGDSSGNTYYGGGKGDNRTPIQNVGDMFRHYFKPMSIVASTKSLLRTGEQAVIYEMNYHMRADDDYKGQQNINIANQMISKGFQMGVTIIGSFAAGGPLVGALATIAMGAQLGFDIYKNYNEQNYRLEQQQTELDYSRVRSGYSLTSGSTGGDK